MSRRKSEPGTYDDIRKREREAGMRGDTSSCRGCKSDLKSWEREEGLCDGCLRSSQISVPTKAAA